MCNLWSHPPGTAPQPAQVGQCAGTVLREFAMTPGMSAAALPTSSTMSSSSSSALPPRPDMVQEAGNCPVLDARKGEPHLVHQGLPFSVAYGETLLKHDVSYGLAKY